MESKVYAFITDIDVTLPPSLEKWLRRLEYCKVIDTCVSKSISESKNKYSR